MTEFTKEDIERQVDVCSWKLLTPHIEKANLFVIADDADFADIAFAIASDDTQRVQGLLKKNVIFRLSPEVLYTWNQIPDKKFRMIVLSPYLLIQEVLDS